MTGPFFFMRRTTDDWEDFGRCRESDPDIWFPTKDTPTTREARRICFQCEVRPQCLQRALADEEPHGIWGGLTERERLDYRRKGDAVVAAANAKCWTTRRKAS